MVSIWDEFVSLWDDWFSMYVVEGDHLKKPMMHAFLGGGIISTTFYHGKAACTARFPIFIIQRTTSGKGQAMKAAFDLLTEVASENLKIDYLQKVTDAGLIGTVLSDKEGSPIPRKGILSDHSCIFIDEASILFNKRDANAAGIRPLLQTALDEPGRLSKALSNGVLNYNTNCSLVAAGYPERNFDLTILHEGLFQRAFVSYKEISSEQATRIFRSIPSLAMKDSGRDKLSGDIKSLLGRLNQPSSIKFSDEAYRRFIELREEQLKSYLHIFSDNRKDILISFLNRSHLIVYRIALHHAVLNNNTCIGIEDIEYAVGLVNNHHFDSVVCFLEVQNKSGNIQYKEQAKLIHSIIGRKEIQQKDLLKKLNAHPEWTEAENATHNLVVRMRREKLLLEDTRGRSLYLRVPQK